MSCESCGWMAAFCSMLAFGSFGVPIKSKRAQSVDVDPLVFQSYKTIMVFLTSWLVLLAGEDFSFSPWGLVSAAFWVPGGVATVYAVKTAGLAIGIGMGSCFIVLVSFIWGIFIFQEHVHSQLGASFAIFCMMGGLFGMAYYSSPDTKVDESQNMMVSPEAETNNDAIVDTQRTTYSEVTSEETEEEEHNLQSTVSVEDDDVLSNHSHSMRIPDDPFDHEPIVEDDGITGQEMLGNSSQYEEIFGMKVAKRTLGMLSAAVFTGIWGGSILVPMKWAPSDAKGVGYLISFAIGASVVTIFLWMVRLCYNAYLCKSFARAYNGLPSFHWRVMWLPGGLGGLLWSIGNFFSLISVYYLGEGVGYPLVQTSILVSGLWGIFYFKEVTGLRRISLWFCSASLAIFGILLLSYEHHAS